MPRRGAEIAITWIGLRGEPWVGTLGMEGGRKLGRREEGRSWTSAARGLQRDCRASNEEKLEAGVREESQGNTAEGGRIGCVVGGRNRLPMDARVLAANGKVGGKLRLRAVNSRRGRLSTKQGGAGKKKVQLIWVLREEKKMEGL